MAYDTDETLLTGNNAISTFVLPVANNDLTITLADIDNFPIVGNIGEEFAVLTLIRSSDGGIEYVKATYLDIGLKTYTIERGEEGTIPLNFAIGDQVRNMLTRDQIDYLRTVDEGSFTDIDNTIISLSASVDAQLQKVVDTTGALLLDFETHKNASIWIDNTLSIPELQAGFYCTLMNKTAGILNISLVGVTSPNILSTQIEPFGTIGLQYRTSTEVWIDGNMVAP